MSLPPQRPPAYDGGSLASVLPAVAASLGVAPYTGVTDPFGLSPTPRAVVVLVDGLGDDLLTSRGGHAPFLRAQRVTTRRLDSGFPSTTATSMGSFGTGLPPGAHGLVGYEVLDPDRDLVFNELSWEQGPDPRAWQPARTVFERVAAAGVAVTRVGPGFFDGSGLTTAALRGGSFVAANALADRVAASVEAVRASKRSLVYLYWGDLDKVGHTDGPQSFEWGEELEAIDAALAELARRVPADTAVYVTADHGMVDVPHALRVDLTHDPALLAGVAHVGGEPRSVQLYCRPGAVADVEQLWRERLGDRAWVASRDEVVGAGWFGPEAQVRDAVRGRIGDVLVLMRDGHSVVQTGRTRPELLALVGMHGSVSEQEVAIPFVTVPARADAG